MVEQLSTTLESIPLTTKRSVITKKQLSPPSDHPMFQFSLENKENSQSANNIDFKSLMGQGTLQYQKTSAFGVHGQKMYETLDSGLKRARLNRMMGRKEQKEETIKKFPVLQDKLNKSLVDFFLLDETGEDNSGVSDGDNVIR